MKPSAPPAPPRRHSSGIRNPDDLNEPQPPTQNYGGQQAYGEPPTMAAARARIHEIARELPAENRFAADDYADRRNYNDETQGRIDPSDLAAAHAAYDRQRENHYEAPSVDAYDQLPALNGPESYYPGEQHDPMTALRPAYDEALQRHEHHADHQALHAFADRALPEDDSSGEYARRRNSPAPPPNSYDAAAYEASYPKGRREEPSYADAPPSDRDRREDGRSFRQNQSYRDERGNSFRRDDRGRDRDEPRAEKSYRRDEERSSYEPPRNDQTRAEGSSAKPEAKRSHESSWSKNEPSIPGPARVPAELRVPDNFVVGVQPIRTPSMGSSSAAGQMPSFPQPQAIITPSAYGPPAVTGAASAMPHISMPPMMAPMAPMTAPMAAAPLHMPPVTGGMHVRAHTSARAASGRAGGHVPQMTELEEAQQGSKVGRFAWFVFGAAFGIFFAFAATGFGFGGKKDEPAAGNFPPAPSQLAPVQTQVPVEQPAPQVVQQPQPVMQQPQPIQQPMPMQPMQQPAQLAPPVAQAPAPPPGVLVAPNQNVGPIVAAQPPVQPQAQAQVPASNRQQARPAPPPRRPAPPPPRANTSRPAAINNGVGADDDAPAPSKKSSSSSEPNIADLLGDGLGK